MRQFHKILIVCIFLLSLVAVSVMAGGPIIIDHNCTDITKVPQFAVE